MLVAMARIQVDEQPTLHFTHEISPPTLVMLGIFTDRITESNHHIQKFVERWIDLLFMLGVVAPDHVNQFFCCSVVLRR